MGRRKIEIRAIKDDRNRSVTFLKRKGGLFKKAHELSVLCSVDVAVIIFGHNKKLYEFSSGDIHETLQRYQYYGQPHEHKGPGDFKNKGGGDDDDEEEDDDNMSPPREDSIPPQYHMQPPLQHNNFAHIRQPQASASPPMPNGIFQPRHSTPQPGQVGSRPSSRDAMRRLSQPMGGMHLPQATPTPPPNGYAFVQNPPSFNPQVHHGAPHQSTSQPPFQSYAPPPPQQQPLAPPPQQPPFQNVQQHQRRASLQKQPVQNGLQPPQLPPARASPQPEQQSLRPPEQNSPPQPKHISSKSHSIYTPIDEGGSVLAQHFFGAPEPPRSIKRETSPDIKPPPAPLSNSQKSTAPPRPSGVPEFQPPSRSNTGGSRSGARPKLNLQIPSEASDNDSNGKPSPQQSAGPSANPVRGPNDHIVLPPPSPSAGAVMSAGANGPPNPFARPPPPTSNSSQNREAFSENRTTNNNNNIETPVSALPSRYLNNDLLPSPSNLFGEWGDAFGRSGGLSSAILPSPLAFPTPSDSKGIGFGRNNESEPSSEKRRGSLSGAEKDGEAKKVKV